ncbi:unnamed protein product [Pylaiella littoralis]
MGNAASGLPFVVGEEVDSYPESPETCSWRMHRGTKRTGGGPVSIFRLDLKTCPPIAKVAGQDAMKSLRTLRHPHVLACLDSVQLETEYVIATEEVIPLMRWVREFCEPSKKDEQVAWGMHCLCSALKFLHEDCKFYHNNISTDTIFVTRRVQLLGGDWKLGGMDLLSPLGGKDYSIAERRRLQPRQFQSAERNNDDWWRYSPTLDGGGVHMPIHCMDVFALGRVLERVYPEGTPAALDKYVNKMLLPEPTKRPTASQYLRCAFLRKQTVKDLTALEMFSVKSPEEKAEILQRFTSKMHSKQTLVHKVVPLLLRELAIASNTTPGALAQGAARAGVNLCLAPLLEFSKEMSDQDFHATVQPAIAGLFAVNDRGVRVMLLTSIPSYGKRLEDNVVNDQVFEPLCAGFTDAAAPLRELTLKSMVAFTQQLSEKNMNDKLIKHLARLQGDAEDSIRTNAIIFLGKVAAQLSPAVRDKVLLPAFARGVKDPFVATRLAGLRATAACHQHFRAEEVCAKVLPTVMLCLIDPGSDAVREAAFACVDTYLSKLREVSARMKVEEAERRKKEAEEKAAELAAHGVSSDPSGGVGGGGGGHATAAAAASKRSSAGAEWGSWALGKLSETLASSALPSSGPVGAGAGAGAGGADAHSDAASPPPSSSSSFLSVPRHHTSALSLNLNGAGNVSASIPGSVASAVAAGLPVGGGVAGGKGRFDFVPAGDGWGEDGGGGGGGGGGEDEWQDARETQPAPGYTNGGSSSAAAVSKPSSFLSLKKPAGPAGGDGDGDGGGGGKGEGWDWDGLDGVGDEDAPPPPSPTPPKRVVSLGLGGGRGAAGTAGRAESAASRREALQKRREARRAQRESNKPKAKPVQAVAKKPMDAAPPDGWEDF